jgi:neutral ceramidase
MNTPRRILSALLLTLIVGVWASSAAPPIFQAGAARSNLTPPLGQNIVGGFHPYPCTAVHDELWAKCLVLDDGATRVAFVVCDVLGIVRPVYEEAARQIEAATGMKRSQLMMSATHSHSAGTVLGQSRYDLNAKLDGYQQFVAKRIADSVQRAVNNLAPARIGWGSAAEPDQVFNRRWYLEPGAMPTNPFGKSDDRVKMNPGRGNPKLVKPAGPTDPEIAFLAVQTPTGKPVAILANYSLHYVGGVKRGTISADYYGYFARRMRRLMGADGLEPECVVMLSNGTSGDINNIDFTKKVPRLPAYEKMKQVANDVAGKTFAALKRVKYRDSATLGSRFEEIKGGVRQPAGKLVAEARQTRAAVKNPAKKTLPEIYADRTLAIASLPRTMPLPLQVFRVGEVGIAAIPNEVLVEIGLELKAKSPFKKSFTHSNAGGYYGYLPSARQFRLGGYETWMGTCWFEEQTAAQIVSRVLNMWGELKP